MFWKKSEHKCKFLCILHNRSQCHTGNHISKHGKGLIQSTILDHERVLHWNIKKYHHADQIFFYFHVDKIFITGCTRTSGAASDENFVNCGQILSTWWYFFFSVRLFPKIWRTDCALVCSTLINHVSRLSFQPVSSWEGTRLCEELHLSDLTVPGTRLRIFQNITTLGLQSMILVNSSPTGQNGYHFADDIFKCIFMNEKFCILIKISLN